MTTRDEELVRAAIGPRAAYYLEKFEKFEREGDGWVATWNWPAFFFSSAWFAYRRMSGRSWLNFFLPLPFVVLMLDHAMGNELRLLIGTAYLALAFVAIPLYANQLYYKHLQRLIARAAAPTGDEKAKERLRPPSFTSGVEAFLTAILALVIPYFLLVAPAAYDNYAPRSRVSEGVSLATLLKSPIAEFYAEHKRFPDAREAEKFRIDGGKYTQSVAYDAGKRMIVVTMGDRFKGQRFAMRAEEKSGTISWTCRTIDLEPRYLPAMCRE